jgi:hypothetical protein
MPKTVVELKRLLEKAKDDLSSATSYEDDAEQASANAQSHSGQAYDTLEELESEINSINGNSTEQLELLASTAGAASKVSQALSLLLEDFLDGSQKEELSNGREFFFRQMRSILTSLVEVDQSNNYRMLITERLRIDSHYGEGNGMIYSINKKEETNG